MAMVVVVAVAVAVVIVVVIVKENGCERFRQARVWVKVK